MFGKDVLDQHREMIYGLLAQNDALKVILGKLSRAMINYLSAKTPDEFAAKREILTQVLEEIAAASGE